MTETSVRKKFKEWKNSLKSSGRSPYKSPLSSPNQSHASLLQRSPGKPNLQQPNCLPSPAQQPVASDLWDEAFRKVNDETQRWIKNHGLDSSKRAKSEDVINLIKEKNKSLFEEKGSPAKIEIGSQKIVFREYVSDIITFLTAAGDLAINFAPPQAGVPWAAAKALLRIPVKQIEQMAALAGAVQLFTRIVQRGQVYEHLYNATTADEEAVSNLRDALRDLYVTAIELLARTDVLIKGGLVKQTLNAILRPEQASDLVSDLLMKEQKVSLEAQVCEASRSAKTGLKTDERIKALLTNLEKLSTPISRIDKGVDNLLEEVEKDRLERLMDFISSEKFGRGHVTIKESRIEGTGDWLINHEGLRDWEAIPSSSTLLCLKGTDDAVKAWARTIPRDLMAAYDQLWENIRTQHNEDDMALAERAVNFDSFEAYISYTWPQHVQRYDRWLGSMESADPDQTLVTTLKRFLGSVEESGNDYRAWLRTLPGHWMSWELEPENMALLVMCRYGFYYVLRDWWEGGKINKKMALERFPGYPGYNAVDLAAKGGCLPICKYLVGVIGLDNPLAKGHSQAMELAIDEQNKDIVSFLVEEAKVDINICYLRETAVQHAARSHRPDILQWLLDQGWVDVNREGGKDYGNALIAAARSLWVKSAEILIKAGADVNAAVECGPWGSALVAACTGGTYDDIEKIRLLLSHGADPNQPMKGGQYGSALEAVIVTAFLGIDEDEMAESTQTLGVLLEAGADPTIITDRGDHGSALAAAACCGFKNFLKMMIDVTGREKAIECLGRSRCPEDIYFRDEAHVESWKQAKSDTITYLTNQVGVESELIYSIGLRDVEPEKHTDPWWKFVIKYD
ncbi:hypothetical protein THAR02_06152 [Trichoderma harzianum]|uniref:Uncharacterized protein n=1 Tax=Trichoderma harzianum TaxID=5544 RepID=A0A0F9X956_TRIHA|nr:hypothetical protein THAR02_06152 [Trichoderma harzianum]